VFSLQYAFVRSRQLEGTFPGDPATGVWPITFHRISWGWGLPPEAAWPHERIDGQVVWPPRDEPLGIDALAHQNLGGLYQRVRSLYECKLVLAYHSPLSAVLDITDKWYDAPQGRIPEYDPNDVPNGTHSVCLLGYDDEKREIKFVNSWGPNWGDNGFGYISYATFERTCWETWRQEFRVKINPTDSEPGLKVRKRGVQEHGGGILHARDIVGPNEERIAWCFAVHRENSLDVEELFVKPEYRQRGYGKGLVRELARLADEVGLAPRIWVPDVDATPDNLAIFARLVSRLDLRVRQSPVRWAPLIACRNNEELTCETLQISDPRPGRPSSPFLCRPVVEPV
jgi:GNAT superfamily N-acetyltransferase